MVITNNVTSVRHIVEYLSIYVPGGLSLVTRVINWPIISHIHVIKKKYH